MPSKRRFRKRRKIISPVKRKILLALAAGLVLGLSRSPKKHYLVYKNLPRAWRAINRRYLYQILDEFKWERLVEYVEKEDGLIEIVLTEAGKARTLQFNIDLLEIKRPARWDGMYRVVFFDIPEQKRKARDAFRRKLKELGFLEWQKSVLVHPHPCRDEIDFIVEFFEIRKYVRYAELANPTNEAELKLHFGLT